MGNSLKYIILVILTLLGQIMIGEYVNITPMVYIAIFPILLLFLPFNMSGTLSMLIAFVIGLAVDSLSDGVLGLNAAACIAVAFFRKPLLQVLLTKSIIDGGGVITSKEIGIKNFILLSILIYTIFFFFYLSLDNLFTLPLGLSLLRLVLNVVINTIILIIVEVILTNNFTVK